MGMKKGYFFISDALVASIIIISGILIFSNLYVEEQKTEHLDLLANDMLNILSDLKVQDINNSYINYLKSNGTLENDNITLIEAIGQLWAIGSTGACENLIKNLTSDFFPDNLGYSFALDNEEMYRRNVSSQSSVVAARKMITGYEKEKPIKGTTSRAYLRALSHKKTFAYAYFGGFVGQGNIKQQLSYLPSDADITSMTIEISAGDDFDVYINDDLCTTISPSEGNMTADLFNISACSSSLELGDYNNITLKYTGSLTDAYIAGGLVRVDYKTKEFTEDINYNISTYNFPEIDGLVNLYSAIYVPGNINSMKFYLHYDSYYQTYLQIGNKQVYLENATGEMTDTVTNATLSGLLNYSELNQQTVPIRFASFNLTNNTIYVGNADVILITDFSGSMKKSVIDWSEGTGKTDCSELYTYDDARKSHLARCVDNELVDVVMNYSGNRIWPVFLHSNTIDYHNEPTDINAIKNYITGYGPQGKDQTCLACALNQGYDLLKEYSEPSKEKFVILMADGVPNYCASGSCVSNSTAYETVSSCNGFCDTNGQSGCGGSADGCADIACQNAEDNTMYAANRLINDFNATIYTVGFGLVEGCSRATYLLEYVANESNGTYQHSSNVTKLREIYQNISHEILNRANLVSQTVVVQGNVSPSKLYSDSYIEMQLKPVVNEPEFGSITFNFQSDQFNTCEDDFDIMDKMTILDAKVASYSGPHWTSNITANGQNVFLLKDYSYNFNKLGDPYFVYIPPTYLHAGTNTISVQTGDDPNNYTGCSKNNSVIYTAALKTSTSYSEVFPEDDGCLWHIEDEDGNEIVANVPLGYDGSKICYYENASYNEEDSIDQAVYGLLQNLDFENNGKINVNPNFAELEIVAVSVSSVPYLWGPAVAEVRLWH